MRLLYITDALAIWGGIERILVEKANRFAENYGYDVYMITVNQGSHPIVFPLSEKVHYNDLDIRFHQQYNYRGLSRLIKKWKLKKLYVDRLQTYVDRVKPDVILTARTEMIPGIVAAKGDVPLVFESHSSFIAHRFLSDGFFSLMKSEFFNRNVKHADMVVALTNGDAFEWRKVTKNVCVIPNVVHINDKGCYSDCKSKTAIFVGRFSRQKDIGSLLKIWSIVHNRFPDWELHVYGGFGEERESIMNAIDNMNINIKVYPPTSAIFEMYCNSSILLLTSLFEPFGLVLPEAMSFGLPVVAFDCPYGPRDIIRDGIDGFIIDNRDINKFAEKVCLLMGNHELRVKMGKEGIKSSFRYEDKKIMPQWVNLFQFFKHNYL